jgi:hypothetical protein
MHLHNMREWRVADLALHRQGSFHPGAVPLAEQFHRKQNQTADLSYHHTWAYLVPILCYH